MKFDVGLQAGDFVIAPEYGVVHRGIGGCVHGQSLGPVQEAERIIALRLRSLQVSHKDTFSRFQITGKAYSAVSEMYTVILAAPMS